MCVAYFWLKGSSFRAAVLVVWCWGTSKQGLGVFETFALGILCVGTITAICWMRQV